MSGRARRSASATLAASLSQPTAAATAAVQVGLCLLGLDQRRAQLGEQAHLVVDGAGVAQDGVLLACLGAAEHAADGAVEQADAVVGQARDGVEHGGDQGGPAAKRRERAQVLGGEAPALARELAQPLRMHALGAGRIEADRRAAGRAARPGARGPGGLGRRAAAAPRPARSCGVPVFGCEQRVAALRSAPRTGRG